MTTSSFPRYNVDASVAVKWHLRDEVDTNHTNLLLEEFSRGRVHLLAPDHIRYEVPSAIRNASRRSRLTVDQGRAMIEEFLDWRLTTVGSDDIIVDAYRQAFHYGCSLYDGLYVALAERARCPLNYADARLRNALGDRFEYGLWFTDYVPAQTL